MARRPVPIKVKSKDHKTIGQLIKRGVHQARVFMRALALRQLGQGITAPQVAAALPLTPKAIREIAHRYNSNGLEAALYDKQRPGAKPVLDDSQKQRNVSLPWSALSLLKVGRAGPCVWSSRKRSNANWSPTR